MDKAPPVAFQPVPGIMPVLIISDDWNSSNKLFVGE